MANYLEYFDLDLLPPFSPGTSDKITGGDSKEKQLDKISFIMNAAEKNHSQPDSSMASTQDDEEMPNNMNFTSSDEAYALKAVDLLELPAVSNYTVSEDYHQNVTVTLSQDQLEQILQTTGIDPATIEQEHLQPISENTNQERKCPVLVIKVSATSAPSVQNAVSNVALITSGHQSHDSPSKANKTGGRRRRREKKEKLYQKPKCDNEEDEKKRQRAIRAHEYRDQKKQKEENLYLEFDEVVKERDDLKIKLEESKAKKKHLMAKLELVREAFEQAQEC